MCICVCMNILYIIYLLEWLTGCGPASTTSAVYQWKVQECSNCPVHRSSAYGGIRREWALMPQRTGLASDSEVKSTKSGSFVLPCPLHSCRQQVCSRFKMVFSPQKRSTLTVGLPTSNDSVKKNSLTGACLSPLGICSFQTVRLTPKNNHQKYCTTHHLRLTLFICMTECKARIPLQMAKVYYNVYSLSHSIM